VTLRAETPMLVQTGTLLPPVGANDRGTGKGAGVIARAFW